jgi:hypothetical protein
LPGVPSLGNNTRDVIHADDPNYNDRLATIKQSNSQFSSDDLASLGITLKSDLELKVAVVIEETGGATLCPILLKCCVEISALTRLSNWQRRLLSNGALIQR